MKIGRLNIEFKAKEKQKDPILQRKAENLGFHYFDRIINEIIPSKATLTASFENYNEIYYSDNNVSKIIDKIANAVREATLSNPLNLDVIKIVRNYYTQGFNLIKDGKIVDFLDYEKRISKYLITSDGEKLNVTHCKMLGSANIISLKRSPLYSLIPSINSYRKTEMIYQYLLENPVPDTFVSEAVPYDLCLTDKIKENNRRLAQMKNETNENEYNIPSELEAVESYIAKKQARLNNARIYYTANQINGFQLNSLKVNELQREQAKEIYESEIVKPFDYPILLISNKLATYSNLETSSTTILNDCFKNAIQTIQDEVKELITFDTKKYE